MSVTASVDSFPCKAKPPHGATQPPRNGVRLTCITSVTRYRVLLNSASLQRTYRLPPDERRMPPILDTTCHHRTHASGRLCPTRTRSGSQHRQCHMFNPPSDLAKCRMPRIPKQDFAPMRKSDFVLQGCLVDSFQQTASVFFQS